MRIGSLFSGIGGLELGLEWSGLGHTVWQVEQSEFCRGVLARHWPDAERFEDVREVGAANLSSVDLICGGFPCQDISTAGKGAGLAGSRSGLWFEYLRVIDELTPRWVVVENVSSGASKWVNAVCDCLAESGYETLPVPLSAADVGAPHLRRRIFVIAHSCREQQRQQSGRRVGEGRTSSPQPKEPSEQGATAHTDGMRLKGIKPLRPTEIDNSNACVSQIRLAGNTDDGGQPAGQVYDQVAELRESPGCSGWDRWTSLSPVCGVDDGVSNRVERLRALGNAVVPQCAEVIGWMIREMETANL